MQEPELNKCVYHILDFLSNGDFNMNRIVNALPDFLDISVKVEDLCIIRNVAEKSVNLLCKAGLVELNEGNVWSITNRGREYLHNYSIENFFEALQEFN